jgi:hypothetical protein
MTPLRIFIGYDERESIAYHVLKSSIEGHASIPVDIRPLVTADLPIFTRPRHPNQSTDFAFTRFLVPYLSGYEGVSVFMDCDMLMRADIAGLLADVPERCAVAVCPHDYTPTSATKMDGQVQTPYPRKNWSSLMVFQNDQCRRLSPYYVNKASAADLHRLVWAPTIGTLPLDWNWLLGEYAPNPDARCWHWTLGGPWFPDYAEAPYAAEWRAARDRMLAEGRGVAV